MKQILHCFCTFHPVFVFFFSCNISCVIALTFVLVGQPGGDEEEDDDEEDDDDDDDNIDAQSLQGSQQSSASHTQHQGKGKGKHRGPLVPPLKSALTFSEDMSAMEVTHFLQNIALSSK